MKPYMSASGIKKFADCPKQWWFRYASDVDPSEADTRYLDLGSAVHETIEDALKAREAGLNPTTKVESQYDVNAAANGVTDDLWDDGLEYVHTAVGMVQRENPDIRDIEAEQEFDVERPDLDETFRAKIDVATESEIWDWKTGSIRDDTPKKEKIQGAVYMAAYRVKYGEPPSKVKFIYLKENEIRKFDPSDDVWEGMMSQAKALAAAKRENQFPARPGDQCHWCDYELYCTEAGGIGVGFDWNEWRAL